MLCHPRQNLGIGTLPESGPTNFFNLNEGQAAYEWPTQMLLRSLGGCVGIGTSGFRAICQSVVALIKVHHASRAT